MENEKQHSSEICVITPAGVIQGTKKEVQIAKASDSTPPGLEPATFEVAEFLGIPYVQEQPVGTKRLRRCDVLEKLPTSPYQAIKYGKAAIQVKKYINIWESRIGLTQLVSYDIHDQSLKKLDKIEQFLIIFFIKK